MLTAAYNRAGYGLTLSYRETTEGGEICRGQENDDWPSHEDRFYFYDNFTLHRSEPKLASSVDSISVFANFNPRKKRAYLVVVKYRDGDTFGSTSGNCYIEGVYKTEKEANKVVKSIENKTYKGYKAWDSYFGGLESVEVVSLDIED